MPKPERITASPSELGLHADGRNTARSSRCPQLPRPCLPDLFRPRRSRCCSKPEATSTGTPDPATAFAVTNDLVRLDVRLLARRKHDQRLATVRQGSRATVVGAKRRNSKTSAVCASSSRSGCHRERNDTGRSFRAQSPNSATNWGAAVSLRRSGNAGSSPLAPAFPSPTIAQLAIFVWVFQQQRQNCACDGASHVDPW
jgi:hypothetical protein